MHYDYINKYCLRTRNNGWLNINNQLLERRTVLDLLINLQSFEMYTDKLKGIKNQKCKLVQSDVAESDLHLYKLLENCREGFHLNVPAHNVPTQLFGNRKGLVEIFILNYSIMGKRRKIIYRLFSLPYTRT